MDPNIIYAAAAYHDTGLVEGRDVHHMASNRQGPRTIYGSILAEADRVIDPHKIIRRTIQYGISNYPELDMEGHWERTVEHLLEKYAEGRGLCRVFSQRPYRKPPHHILWRL